MIMAVAVVAIAAAAAAAAEAAAAAVSAAAAATAADRRLVQARLTRAKAGGGNSTLDALHRTPCGVEFPGPRTE